jgi:hypothetical protein
MTELEFVEILKWFGYDEDGVKDFLLFQKESGISFEEIAIEEHLID